MLFFSVYLFHNYEFRQIINIAKILYSKAFFVLGIIFYIISYFLLVQLKGSTHLRQLILQFWHIIEQFNYTNITPTTTLLFVTLCAQRNIVKVKTRTQVHTIHTHTSMHRQLKARKATQPNQQKPIHAIHTHTYAFAMHLPNTLANLLHLRPKVLVSVVCIFPFLCSRNMPKCCPYCI